MNKIYVFGHKNPDTDSVCGSISLSYLKNQLGLNTEARVLSEINDETRYALKYFDVKEPKILNDVKVRIKDIKYHKDYYVDKKTSIFDTYNYMNDNNITGIPLVNDDKTFAGYVSLKEIAKTMIVDTNNYISTNFDSLIRLLNSEKFIQYDDIIKGYVVLDNNSDIKDNILITNNISNIEKLDNIKTIILCNNKLFDDSLFKDKEINVISTQYDCLIVSKLINLSNNIDTIKRDENCICVDSEDYMSDFIMLSNKTKHTNYPIVNNKGICNGMLRLIDTNEYNKNKVILVDHNESKQSVDGLEEAEILEIIDHHNISDIHTYSPIYFRNMIVGSVNTIIYYLYKENNIEIPYDIAGLMISGIISDTLLLNSPTTTIQDKIVLKELSNKFDIDYEIYGMNLLKSGMDIKGKSIRDIIYGDYKSYNINNYKFGIGQALTVDFNDYTQITVDIIHELNNISYTSGYGLVTLFVTNIINKKSMILYNELGEDILKEAFNIDDIYEGIIIDDILSRKKQIVPNIMNIIEK